MSPLLEVHELRVQGVGPLSYSVEADESIGIVGEPGSGKTLAALALMRLTGHVSGRILLDGRDLMSVSDEELRRIRGNQIGMTFQDSHSSLHPFYRLGWQVAEAILAHHRVSKAAARDRVIDLLELVGISDPHLRLDVYPHELDDTAIELAAVAVAIANQPQLLIADDPTTAQLELLKQLREGAEMAIIVTGRDGTELAEVADRIYAMPYSSST
jgi:peptide/nickel transport system ATP-binding protein